MSEIRLAPRGKGIDGGLLIPIPAEQVVVTTLVVASGTDKLPTLSSVERVIARLASVGLALEDPRETDRIAELINRKFLPVEQAKWRDQTLTLKAVRADGQGGPESLRAVAALRNPTLNAADFALTSGGAYGPVERRANEIRLVNELSQAVIHRKPVWMQYGKTAMWYLARTALPIIVEQLIGLPVSDLIRSTLKGADRLVF